ncbi:MAG: hypothetical protein QG635_2113 [Bacteroidota bacterium]|nr:hypothetical protein [Bacteroidota bacterium]
MAFIRRIKKESGIYLAKVENYRSEGKVKQRVIEYIGKEEDGKVIPKKTAPSDFNISKVTQFLDVFTVDCVAKALELHDFLGHSSKQLLTLIYSHLVHKVSIYRLPQWAEKSEIINILKLKKISSKELYNSISELAKMDFEIIQKMLAKKFRAMEDDNRIAVLDITDTYFSGKEADWKSRRGKDGKYDKLVQIALAVTYNKGFPIMHKTYEGNISNIKIFEDMVNDLKIYGYDSVIVDRGMCSQKNIDNLHQYGLKGIMGFKVTNRIGDEYLSKMNRKQIFTKQCQVELKNTKVYIQGFEYGQGRLIAIFNPLIEVSQREKYFDKSSKSRANKYFGYSLIYHNLNKPDTEIVSKYFDKDIVERSFKKIKGPISLHPLNVWKLENIKTHIKICYMAYAILSYIDWKVKSIGLTGIEALNTLQGGYKVYIDYGDGKSPLEKVVTIKNIQQQIMDSLNVVYKM